MQDRSRLSRTPESPRRTPPQRRSQDPRCAVAPHARPRGRPPARWRRRARSRHARHRQTYPPPRAPRLQRQGHQDRCLRWPRSGHVVLVAPAARHLATRMRHPMSAQNFETLGPLTALMPGSRRRPWKHPRLRWPSGQIDRPGYSWSRIKGATSLPALATLTHPFRRSRASARRRQGPRSPVGLVIPAPAGIQSDRAGHAVGGVVLAWAPTSPLGRGRRACAAGVRVAPRGVGACHAERNREISLGPPSCASWPSMLIHRVVRLPDRIEGAARVSQ